MFDDLFYGNSGSDFIHGGDLFREHKFDGSNSVNYSTWDSFTEKNSTAIMVTLGSADAVSGARFGEAIAGETIFVNDGHGGNDRLISIENIYLPGSSKGGAGADLHRSGTRSRGMTITPATR